jgi:cellulose biosynthesis protein BcsQ
MSQHVPVLTFFNNKGGVGKTSLIYHLAWMYASLRKRVVIADFDPQANLTAAFLDEEKIEDLWGSNDNGITVYRCINHLSGVSDIEEIILQRIETGLYLIPGDVRLSNYEETLSYEWGKIMIDGLSSNSMKTLAAFWQIMQKAATQVQADIILVDIGPNLGALNRSILIAVDYVIIPLRADLFSVQGLKQLGATLNGWKSMWKESLNGFKLNSPNQSCRFPEGKMMHIGYCLQQQSMLLGRTAKPYYKWINRISHVYREAVLNQENGQSIEPEQDPYCLAMIKHYRSLIPMAQEHRKPIFNLTSADGAIGSHANAAQAAKEDFRRLSEKIASRIGLSL